MKIFAAEHGIENYEICIYNDKTVEDGIVHFVAKYDIDIITIGTNQRTGLNKIINGCVSADLVNHVYKPILTFKLKD
jgi:nucleotide-binding universal stress UspA family protein